MNDLTIPPGAAKTLPPERVAALREAAVSLEASFLSQILKDAGWGAMPKEFGGGAGEDQFSSFLRDAQAERIAAVGGIGLAQSIFNSMVTQ